MSSRIEKGRAKFRPTITPRRSTSQSSSAIPPSTSASTTSFLPSSSPSSSLPSIQPASSASNSHAPQPSTPSSSAPRSYAFAPTPTRLNLGPNRPIHPPSKINDNSVASSSLHTSSASSSSTTPAFRKPALAPPRPPSSTRSSQTPQPQSLNGSSSDLSQNPTNHVFAAPQVNNKPPSIGGSRTKGKAIAPGSSRNADSTLPDQTQDGSKASASDEVSEVSAGPPLVNAAAPPAIGGRKRATKLVAPGGSRRDGASSDKADQQPSMGPPSDVPRSKQVVKDQAGGVQVVPGDTTSDERGDITGQAQVKDLLTSSERTSKTRGSKVTPRAGSKGNQEPPSGSALEIVIEGREAPQTEVGVLDNESEEEESTPAPETSSIKNKRRSRSESASTSAVDGRRRKKQLKSIKDPSMPKKPRSAYFMFLSYTRPERAKDLPDLSITELMKKLGDEWRSMTSEEKARFEEEAEIDKQRYRAEMSEWVDQNPGKVVDPAGPRSDLETDEALESSNHSKQPPSSSASRTNTRSNLTPKEKRAQARKRQKMKVLERNSGKPKKPATAYLMFVNSVRSERQNEFPQESITEITARMAGEWREMGEEERSRWKQESLKEKEAYQRALQDWKDRFPQGVRLPSDQDSDSDTSSDTSSEGSDEQEEENPDGDGKSGRKRKRRRRSRLPRIGPDGEILERKPREKRTISDDEREYLAEVEAEGPSLAALRLDPTSTSMKDLAVKNLKRGRAGPRTFELERVRRRQAEEKRKAEELSERIDADAVRDESSKGSKKSKGEEEGGLFEGEEEEGEEEEEVAESGQEEGEGEGPKSASHIKSKRRRGSSVGTEHSFAENRFAVQTRIVDGKIVVDETSLFANYGEDDEMREGMEVIDEREGDKFINSATRGKGMRKLKNWNYEDTEKFYKSLSQWGTDFEMIARLFPGRNRVMIKKKYQIEERANPKRIDEALLNKVEIDLEDYAQAAGVDLSGPPPEIRASFHHPSFKGGDEDEEEEKGGVKKKEERGHEERGDEEVEEEYEEEIEVDQQGNEVVRRRPVKKKATRKAGKPKAKGGGEAEADHHHQEGGRRSSLGRGRAMSNSTTGGGGGGQSGPSQPSSGLTKQQIEERERRHRAGSFRRNFDIMEEEEVVGDA
ncbi:hypothetical protein IE53DRAFT_327531 [Violaceomyces palustris]|uniref:Uncharacterized protein n=1 Tax=Violaceomyces palustris TaxID=1673888 RepID=A0ACD0P222_9BASI|nr:hypothetical protein IE53DRAFT_327531 [Violaceomyces palustris]